MKLYSHNRELLYAHAQFKKLFDNVVIRRNKRDGGFDEHIVPCVISQRSRIRKNLENLNRGSLTLPMISITRTGISRDSSRVTNIHDHLKATTSSIDYNRFTPVPINLGFDVEVMTKFPNDMDVILSNFIPFFNQDLYVRTPHPKNENETLRHQVIWDGTINNEWPSELDAQTQDMQVATTSFTFKTWIFAGEELPGEIEGLIESIDFTLSGVSDIPQTGTVGGFFAVPRHQDFSDFYDNLSTGNFTPEYDELRITSDS